MYQREAMWIAFDCGEKPCAIMIGTGGINAISGESWNPGLRRDPQNYVVCPDQPWLDGFSTGEAIVRQFVAMPLGSGYTAGEQLAASPSNELHLVLYRAHSGFKRPQRKIAPVAMAPKQLGLAAGGRIHQRIYPDPYPPDTWDPNRKGTAEVVLLTTVEYRRITKREPPPSPIDAKTYAEHGFPWFEFYDEHEAALGGSKQLAGLKSPGEVDAVTGRGHISDDRIDIRPDTIQPIRRTRKSQRSMNLSPRNRS
jgi:hypothetical protein